MTGLPDAPAATLWLCGWVAMSGSESTTQGSDADRSLGAKRIGSPCPAESPARASGTANSR